MDEGAEEVPFDIAEDQGERVRRSLVMMDVNLPSIALPDGVHCRAFTGAPSYIATEIIRKPLELSRVR